MAKKKNLREALKRIYVAFRFSKDLYIKVDLPESNITEASIYVKEGDTERILTTSGGGGEEWTKTNLYVNENPTSNMLDCDVPFTDDFDYLECKYVTAVDNQTESIVILPMTEFKTKTAYESMTIGAKGYYRNIYYNNGLRWDYCYCADSSDAFETNVILTEVNGYRKAV